MFDFTYGMS